MKQDFRTLDLGRPSFMTGDILKKGDNFFLCTFVGERVEKKNHYRVHVKRVKLRKSKFVPVTGNIEILWRNYRKVFSSEKGE